MACGGAHNLALVHEPRGDNGTVAALYVWGSDIFGECGLEIPEESVPEPAAAGARASQEHGLAAARLDGGAGGQAAIDRQRGTLRFHAVPRRNTGVAAASVTDMQCGSAHSLILCFSGLVLAFGRGEYGQQGNGQLSHVRTPAAVPFFDHSQPLPQPAPRRKEDTPAQRLQRLRWAAGGLPCSLPGGGSGLPHADCARQRAPVEGRGETSGQEGDEQERPVARGIAAGGEHCFAIDMQGGVWAWGWNSFGQLGPIESAAEEKVAAQRLPPACVCSLALSRALSLSLSLVLSLSLTDSNAHTHTHTRTGCGAAAPEAAAGCVAHVGGARAFCCSVPRRGRDHLRA